MNSATKQNTAMNMNNNNRTVSTMGGTNSMMSGYGSSLYGNNSYGSGGYGSSYGMGSSMYGSSMYGSSMYGSSMYGGGMMNNNMNMMNPNQQQQQQPGFRDEYQGVLIGFNSMLNIMGAGIGMIGYGTTFFHYTKKAISFIFSCFSNFTYKILGIAYLKKLMRWITNSHLEKDFAAQFQSSINAAEKSSIAQRIFGKLLVVVRVLSGLALLGFYFMQYKLRKRMQQMQQEQQNMNHFDEHLGPLIFDNQNINNTTKNDDQEIRINMNSDKAEIIDNLDDALNEDEQEEVKEGFEEILKNNENNNEEENITIIDATATDKPENLQDAFENVMNQEKSYIQQTQVRSEEFWKHTRPQDYNNTTTQQQTNQQDLPIIQDVVVTENVAATATPSITEQTINESSQQQQQQQEELQEETIENQQQQPQQQNNFFFNPIANSYPETNFNYQQPMFPNVVGLESISNNSSNINNSNEVSINNTDLFSSQPSILGDQPIQQQQKIFKQVSNRLKPWQK